MSFITSVAWGATDEEGPLITNAVVTSSGPYRSGDVISIVLTMYDPGGAGIRNTQFYLRDKFGRTKDPFNGMDCGSICTMYGPGTSISEVTFQFRVDQTWGTDGYATLGAIRTFDKLTNGTYFYDDGRYENLQTRTLYPGKHPLDGLRLTLGNPPFSSPTTIPVTSPSTTTSTQALATSTTIATALLTPQASSSTDRTSLREKSSIKVSDLVSRAGITLVRNSRVNVTSQTSTRCRVVRNIKITALKSGSCVLKLKITAPATKANKQPKSIIKIVRITIKK
jgi:hypothetical protein